MAKEPFTLEKHFDKAIAKIQDKPFRVMNTIGSNLVKEIKQTTLRSQYNTRYKIISKSLNYWARKQEKDLQIGFKMSITKNKYGVGPGIVGGIMSGAESDPLKPVVLKNAEAIKELIGIALKEIDK
jgi:hypothetical protein